jgi:hypothetical protein
MPGIEAPPLAPPPADCEPPELPLELEEPPEDPPLEPDEPPEDPEDPPLELGLEGIEEDDCCCWAHPPISKAETELTAMQWMAIVSNRRVVGDDAPVAETRVV